MKVLHLLGAREDTGGVLTVLRNLQQATEGANVTHDVWVGSGYREKRPPALRYRFSRHLVGESPNYARLLFSAFRALPELRRLLAREPFEVLHAHSRASLVLSVLMARLGPRPVLFTNHAYARRRAMYRWAARQPGLITVVLTPNMARHYGLPIERGKVRVISACCADPLFVRPLVARRSELGAGRVRLVGLGNVIRWKNWHLVLQALAQLTPARREGWEFHHWGPVPADSGCAAYADELAAMVNSAGLRSTCHFHGSTTDVSAALRDADAFLLPSTNEPCSVALMEALASGVPAIVSASGGNVDILEPGRTGLLFEPDDAASLAETLESFRVRAACLASPAAIRQSVAGRSATAVARQYLEVYEQVRWPPGPTSER